MNENAKNDFFKRYEKIILNIVIIISVCCLVTSMAARFSVGEKRENRVINYINTVSDMALGGIFADSQITQTFYMAGDIDAINIMFSTYARENVGQVEVQLKRVDDDSVMHSSMVDVSTLKDNEYAHIALEKPINLPFSTLMMLIVNGVDGSDGNLVSVNVSKTDIYLEGALEVNGTEHKGDLVFNVETSTPVSPSGYWITALVLIFILVAGYLVYEIIKNKIYMILTKKQVMAAISVVMVLSCFGISILAYYQAAFTAISSNTVSQQANEETVDSIFSDVQVKQTFMVEKNFTGVSLNFATYARKNIGELNVIVRQSSTGRVVHSTTISMAGLSDNTSKRINFGKLEKCYSPTLYEVIITSPVSLEDNAVTIWKSADDSYPEGELYVNGVLQKGDLCFSLFGINSVSPIIFYWTIAVIGTIILTALALYLYMKKTSDIVVKGAEHAAGGNI